MLIEVKAKVARVIDSKTTKRTETYVVPDCEIFSNAEYAAMNILTAEQNNGVVESFEIQSLRLSPIKEVATQFTGHNTFIATLKDIFHEDDGTEKSLRYKVLLWADDITQANHNVQQLARQGYDMQIEGIKQVDYEYLAEQSNQEETGDE